MLELESNVQISTKIGKLLHISTFELDDVDKVEYWIGLMIFFMMRWSELPTQLELNLK